MLHRNLFNLLNSLILFLVCFLGLDFLSHMTLGSQPRTSLSLRHCILGRYARCVCVCGKKETSSPL
ncbi:hypothetical protein BDV27DRAFT_120136 [Aspergillus caelatus]|uniref:Uncharacterized protein n=1 Tax=Aspergillus caelatus TaxID=61420 RepID=A0A5N7AJU1_9EURO|nr:uncharacterized protein BDV27DRAFT_120136 [Aspergillus caelatus]KAE8369963.1 hypothetical protein BDV27DRAFT_120136 [Aspergillus caelatus]